MITLCIIGYIIFSLILALMFKKPTVDVMTGTDLTLSWKDSVLFGFCFIPLILSGVFLFICFLWLAAFMLGWVIEVGEWVYHNMP